MIRAADYFSFDTIAAISTSLSGDGGVGIIRLSGPCSLQIAQSICEGLEKPNPRFLHRIVIKDRDESVLDDGLGVYFEKNSSFTGEEVVELQVHGGRVLLQKILSLILETGKSRLALPGEFSFRAVRNGKMTTLKAETINQIVHAKSIYEVKESQKNISKDRIREFNTIIEKIRNLLTLSELSIDFIDQDVEVVSLKKAKNETLEVKETLEKLIKRMKLAKRIASGIKVVLVGEPNAGKSTLFNALLAEDRSIVSSQAGTTRDIVSEEFFLDPYVIKLSDTAGLRQISNEIEKSGIQKALDLAEIADLIILVVDGSQEMPEIERSIQKIKKSVEIDLLVLNKTDLVSLEKQNKNLRSIHALTPIKVVSLSAKNELNLDHLLEAIKELLENKIGLGLNTFLPSEIQLEAAESCYASILNTIEVLNAVGLEQPELVSSNLFSAAGKLAQIVGETSPEDVLQKIFSEFCIGK